MIGGEDVRLLINDVEREHPAVPRRLLRWSPPPHGSAKAELDDGPFRYFGILGLWRPFTRDMQLGFLTGPETARLHGSVNRMRVRCPASGTLRSLTAVDA